jgi:hypothetical protein
VGVAGRGRERSSRRLGPTGGARVATGIGESDHRDEAVHIRAPSFIRKPDCVEIGESPQARRQLIRGRHPRTVDEDRDHPDARHGERPLRLHAHEVLGLVDAPPTGVVNRRRPTGPDHREEHAHVLEDVFDGVGRGLPNPDDIEEDLVVAKARPKAVEQPARMPGRILPPVAQVDATHLASKVTRAVSRTPRSEREGSS